MNFVVHTSQNLLHPMLTHKKLHKLSKQELEAVVPQGTFPRSLCWLPWKDIEIIVACQPDGIQEVIYQAAEEKVMRKRWQRQVFKTRSESK